MSGFSVSAVPLDVPALRAALQNPAHGGFCAFEGWVRNRNDGRAVEGLEYEAVGDLAVWVGVSSAHRDAAFRACRYIIDAFKHRLPVWKKERYADGDAHWVVCSHGSDPHSSASHAPERDSRR
jgi:molybdopterin synthase catalytic subunit